jgi:hypothetical protein
MKATISRSQANQPNDWLECAIKSLRLNPCLMADFVHASSHHLLLIAPNAARVLNTTRELLGTDFAEVNKPALCAKLAGGGAVLVPYFEAERSPKVVATASIHGLSMSPYPPETITRASIEGVGCLLADCPNATIQQGLSPRRILMIGGSAQNPASQSIAPPCLATRSKCQSQRNRKRSVQASKQPGRSPVRGPTGLLSALLWSVSTSKRCAHASSAAFTSPTPPPERPLQWTHNRGPS